MSIPLHMVQLLFKNIHYEYGTRTMYQCSPKDKFKACQGTCTTVEHALGGGKSLLLVEAMATLRLLESPYSYIKENSVLKACWADMPYVC